MDKITYSNADVDGMQIFYREAGERGAVPSILLLHGFPSASHQFRDLIPLLCDRFHVIAPDFPGFGQSEMRPHDQMAYTFENIAKTMTRFSEIVRLERFAVYMFDYGAPVGLRMALMHPERVAAIVSQNGNAYAEGLSNAWEPIRTYWNDPSKVNRDALRVMLKPETTIWQYTEGAPDKALVSPDGYSLDNYYLARPGNDDIQLDLFLDYASNLMMYPSFQDYFREMQPPLLAIWGCHDPFFLPGGAEAYKRDLPSAQVRFLDAGHFAIETHAEPIAAAVTAFLSAHPMPAMRM
jgi:pimeloyl-ACP methyl ester carboxylesterase